MKDRFLEVLTLPENLYWAWLKTKSFFEHTEKWYDELEVAGFELNLDTELRRIREQFLGGAYEMTPMRPLLLPKDDDEEGKPRLRQAFWIGVRDQVAWTAVLNAAGPTLEMKMPRWSYGNRLFRTQVPRQVGDKTEFLIGPWRNTTRGYTYRVFRHCWPLYRRHILVTIWCMTGPEVKRRLKMALDETEQSILDSELALGQKLSAGRSLPYVQPHYWRKYSTDQVYWAGLDLAKFYPEIRLEKLLQSMLSYLPQAGEESAGLLESMLRFPLDTAGFDATVLAGLGRLNGIPTNLNAAGFLANVAMLDVDQAVLREASDYQVAHFRYVDDHVVLAQDFDTLHKWILRYDDILRELGPGPARSASKTDPEELRNCLCKAGSRDEAEGKCRVDVRYPAPLMTKTLAKLSRLAQMDVELLDSQSRLQILADLEQLLLTEFPEHEIPTDTRVSFAASKLAFLSGRLRQSVEGESDLQREIVRLESLRGVLLARGQKRLTADERSEIAGIEDRIKQATSEKDSLQRERLREESKQHGRIWPLILRATRQCHDKPTVWGRALAFCRITGYEGAAQLVKEVNRLSGVDPLRKLAASFLRAMLLQLIARDVIRGSAEIESAKDPSDMQAHIRRHLRDLAGDEIVAFAQAASEGPTYYERKAAVEYSASLGVARFLLARAQADSGAIQNSTSKVAQAAVMMTAPQWESGVAAWAELTGVSAATWLWWAERKLRRDGDIEPSVLWLTSAIQLSPDEADAWIVILEHPEEVPEAFLAAIDVGRAKRNIEDGWFADMDTAIRRHHRSRDMTPVSPRDKVRVSTEKSTKWFHLQDWVEWTSQRALQDQFDPRVNEWTALEITRQVAEEVSRFMPSESSEGPLAINPYLVRVPRVWTRNAPIGRRMTWEFWREKARKRRVGVVRSVHFRDGRYFPVWSPDILSDTDWAPLHALGMLLLGLLRRSFRWPSVWNIPEQRRAYSALSGMLLGSLRCSSRTLGVLSACLDPRARETVLLPLFHPEELFTDADYEPDIELDPPQISDLDQLQDRIEQAQEKLASLQLTVREYGPRQLTPVSIGRLTRTVWSDEEEMGP
jgi:hypothetical protein